MVELLNMTLSKQDIKLSLLAGEIMALLSFGILKNFGFQAKWIYFVWPVFLPILCLVGIWVAYFISKFIPFVLQAARFVLVGGVNTFIDLGVLNLLILFFGLREGSYFLITAISFFSLYKGISFLVAVINSYFWNKFWAFKKEAKKELIEGKEFTQFIIVSVIGFVLNLAVASFIVVKIIPQFGMTANMWANFGAIVATLFVMTWNFLGYRFIVFK